MVHKLWYQTLDDDHHKTFPFMKMYIVVKDNIPDKLNPDITAHASLACYKKKETLSFTEINIR